jgi:hypothetical protein
VVLPTALLGWLMPATTDATASVRRFVGVSSANPELSVLARATILMTKP